MADQQTIAQIQQILQSDPMLRALYGQLQSTPRTTARDVSQGPSGAIRQQIEQRQGQLLQQSGLSLPKDYKVDVNSGTVSKASYVQRNADWIVPAFGAVVGAGALGGLLGGAGAASGAGHSLGGGLAAGGGSAAGPFSAAGVMGAAGGGYSGVQNALSGGQNPATSGGSFLTSPDFWSAILGTGTQLIGAKLASDANNKALEQQNAALEKAIGLQRDMYQQDRNDRAPYRASGQGSVGKLSYLLGVPGFEGGALSHQPPPGAFDLPPQAMPQQQPSPSLSVLGGPGSSTGIVPPQMPAQQPSINTGMTQPPQGQMVTLRAPDGSVQQFPEQQAQFYIQRGAQRIA